MNRFLKLISLTLLVFVLASCSKKVLPSQTANYPIIHVNEDIQRWNMKIDFGKHHFSGMIILRQMQNQEIRILFTSHFGLSVFDLGMKGDEWIIYSCVEPMRDKRIQNLLKNDFRLLFLPDRKFRKTIHTSEYTEYTAGRFMGKTRIKVNKTTAEKPKDIKIEHPWLNLTLELEQIPNKNVTD